MSSPIKNITSRETKVNILAAYRELANAYRALEKKSKSGSSAGATKAPTPSASTAMVVASSLPAFGSGLAGHLSQIGSQLGEHTSGLQQKLTAEALRLLDLRAKADTMTADLRRLYDIEVEGTSLLTLIEEYERTATTTSEEQKEKAEASKLELDSLRDAWSKERKVHATAVREAASELKKSRTREAEAYAYELEQRRKQEQDERAQAIKAFEAELREVRVRAQVEEEAREKAISERERELSELTARAESFEEELSAAREKGERVGTGIATRDARLKAELTQKETEGQARVFELRIASLEETLSKQATQIGSLSRQLDTALAQAQDLAVKAIEGSSNATSFEAIREIAMEQAKNSSKNK